MNICETTWHAGDASPEHMQAQYFLIGTTQEGYNYPHTLTADSSLQSGSRFACCAIHLQRALDEMLTRYEYVIVRPEQAPT